MKPISRSPSRASRGRRRRHAAIARRGLPAQEQVQPARHKLEIVRHQLKKRGLAHSAGGVRFLGRPAAPSHAASPRASCARSGPSGRGSCGRGRRRRRRGRAGGRPGRRGGPSRAGTCPAASRDRVAPRAVVRVDHGAGAPLGNLLVGRRRVCRPIGSLCGYRASSCVIDPGEVELKAREGGGEGRDVRLVRACAPPAARRRRAPGTVRCRRSWPRPRERYCGILLRPAVCAKCRAPSDGRRRRREHPERGRGLAAAALPSI